MQLAAMPSAQTSVTHGAGALGAHQEPRTLRIRTNHTPAPAAFAPPAAAPDGTPNTIIPDASREPGETAPEATEPLSPQVAAIARQRRALQLKEREIAAREAALKPKDETAATPPARPVDLARVKADPLSVLLEAGVTYDELTQAVMAQQNGVSPSEYRKLQAEVEALKSGIDERFTERDADADKQALALMQRDATRLVAQGDQFELIREQRAVPAVMSLIERTHRESGELLTVDEACRLVEDQLLEDTMKVVGLGKVKAKLQPAAPPPPVPTQRPMHSISNRDSSQAPMSAKQRALAAFWGQPIKR